MVLSWKGREMRKISSVLTTVLWYAFYLYFLSVNVMMCYYWWTDVKAHDGFLRAVVWSPVVGTFKATHWPYYVFIQSRGTEEPEPPSIVCLKRSFWLFQSAQPLIRALPSSQDPARDIQAVLTLLQRAKAEAEKADITELNSVTPGMGDMVSEKYLYALEHYCNALSPDGDIANLSRGLAAMVEFVTWAEGKREHAP